MGDAMIRKIAISLLAAGLAIGGLVMTGVLQPIAHDDHHVEKKQGEGESVEESDGTEQSDGQQKKVESSSNAPAHRRLLAYLTSSSEAVTEGGIRRFLSDELKLDSNTESNYLRICFWNKFITLQHKEIVNQNMGLRKAFAIELELKQASFKALGLELDHQEVARAKQEVESLADFLDPEGSGEGG